MGLIKYSYPRVWLILYVFVVRGRVHIGYLRSVQPRRQPITGLKIKLKGILGANPDPGSFPILILSQLICLLFQFLIFFSLNSLFQNQH